MHGLNLATVGNYLRNRINGAVASKYREDTPLEIRESVYPLSWKAQMQKVIKEAGFGSLE